MQTFESSLVSSYPTTKTPSVPTPRRTSPPVAVFKTRRVWWCYEPKTAVVGWPLWRCRRVRPRCSVRVPLNSTWTAMVETPVVGLVVVCKAVMDRLTEAHLRPRHRGLRIRSTRATTIITITIWIMLVEAAIVVVIVIIMLMVLVVVVIIITMQEAIIIIIMLEILLILLLLSNSNSSNNKYPMFCFHLPHWAAVTPLPHLPQSAARVMLGRRLPTPAASVIESLLRSSSTLATLATMMHDSKNCMTWLFTVLGMQLTLATMHFVRSTVMRWTSSEDRLMWLSMDQVTCKVHYGIICCNYTCPRVVTHDTVFLRVGWPVRCLVVYSSETWTRLWFLFSPTSALKRHERC